MLCNFISLLVESNHFSIMRIHSTFFRSNEIYVKRKDNELITHLFKRQLNVKVINLASQKVIIDI